MTSRRLLTPVAKVLLDAADYIEKYGHHKGAFRHLDHPEMMPRVCAIGALIMVEHHSDARCAAGERLEAFIGSRDIPGWNDAPERTAGEVISALRGAALAQDQRHD